MTIVEREVLRGLTETGVEPLVWYPATIKKLYPRWTNDEVMASLKDAVRHLLLKDYFEICLDWDGEQKIERSDAMLRVNADDVWRAPQHGGLLMVVTEKGIHAYERTDEACYSAEDSLTFVDECESNKLAVYGIALYSVRDGILDEASLQYLSFRDTAGDSWEDFFRGCNFRAREHLRPFLGRSDVVFYPAWTSADGPDHISPLQRSSG